MSLSFIDSSVKPASRLLLLLLIASCASFGGRHIIGQTARIKVVDAGLSFRARIDTGAKTTSIHAIDIQIENGSEVMTENIGKEITFKIINEKNEEGIVKTKIKDVSTIKNAKEKEFRYVVEMKLSWNGVSKKVRVNLRDREEMEYKLLIGRNWLENDFLVDVDRRI